MKRFWLRLKFAWQAFKNADRALYGIIIGVDFEGGMPSAVEGKVSFRAISTDGQVKRAKLEFFGSARAIPQLYKPPVYPTAARSLK